MVKEIIQWIFNIINGLEGFWTSILHILFRLNQVQDSRNEVCAKEIRLSVIENPVYDDRTVNTVAEVPIAEDIEFDIGNKRLSNHFFSN